jgi:hypothetical protein
LSDSALDAQKSGGRKVAIVVDDLFDIGIDGPDDAKDATLVGWLVRVAEAMKKGAMNVFVDGEPQNVNLADTVFILRARRDPSELTRILDDNLAKYPDLAVVKDALIGVPGDPEQNVKSLEATLGSELKHVDNVTVTLGDDLRERVLGLFSDDKSTSQVKTWLSEALADAARSLPAQRYTVELKGRREGLTDKARDRVFEGGFFGVGNPFKVAADVGAAPVQLPFASQWADVHDELAFFKDRASQLEAALARAAKRDG